MDDAPAPGGLDKATAPPALTPAPEAFPPAPPVTSGAPSVSQAGVPAPGAGPDAPPGPPPPAEPSPADLARRRTLVTRRKVLGAVIAALAAFMLASTMFNVAFYNSAILTAGPQGEGGDLQVIVQPPGNYTVRLVALDGQQAAFAEAATDQEGTVSFERVQDAVFRLEVTGNTTAHSALVEARKDTRTTVHVDTASPAPEWFGRDPRIVGFQWAIIAIFAAVVAVAIVGGFMLFRGIHPRWASAGSGAAIAVGVLTFGGATLFAAGLAVAGIWGLVTIRRNPDLFRA